MYLLIAPDIPKLENSYWYKFDGIDQKYSRIKKGSIIRVNLHGRKARGWVLEISQTIDNPDIDLSKVKDIIEYVSDGPPEHLIDFAFELSKYYLVSPVTFLRACSPRRIFKNLEYLPHSVGISAKTKAVIVSPRANRKKLIEENLARSGSTIIITPDSQKKFAQWLIGLGKTVIEHNDKSPNIYAAATKNNCIVIGGRSAIFSPVTDLKSIIILDDSYEQLQEERTPKYHVTDIAKLANEKWGVDLTVITSVPNVHLNKFQVLDKREISPTSLIAVENLNEKDPVFGLFTPAVIATIKQSLQRGKDAAVILNSTVTSKILVCRNCETLATCETCGHSVAEIASNTHPLFCSVCKTSRPEICLFCKSTKFKKFRKGTKGITNDCESLFSNTNVYELTKNSEPTLNGDPNIFVATESIFHRQTYSANLGCCVFLDLDTVILRPSINAFRQAFVLVNRALRSIKSSPVLHPILITTKIPNHEVILDLANSDFVSHNIRELDMRKYLNLAPWVATAEISSISDAIDCFAKSIPKELIKGIRDAGEKKSVLVSAVTHEKLAEDTYLQARHLASNNTCTIYVDTYD